ncbi:type VII secretion-associated serine protease mycosin [Symbioplanes lichenis]|uniref:type VII secretion-associated serine protease mycosin n=1 Tax=Symbioplanes lichenis TaxID=1629072 RepID=UPI002738A7AE|nr:type VII secretion-associated serine protease mycosin [Actinoplanes lichenis]
MRFGQRAVAWAAAAVLVTSGGAAPAAAARRAPAPCQNPSESGQVITATPWQQQWLAPERVWPFSTGAGIRVAVVDSGTDSSHPQLAGKVDRGFDMLSNSAGGDIDCVSHGTAVASIIAAQRVQGVGFAGIAPDARILPIRVSEREVVDGKASGQSVSPEGFADAIRLAADRGAKVINMSLTLYENSPAVAAAVRYAQAKDAVLVAAAGNLRENGNPVPYPAAYDGVIGVGAIDNDGGLDKVSQIGSYVDIVAPGGAVVAATRVRGHQEWTGTSFATPMVSATVALIRAAEPGLDADEVRQRLLATADPARGGAAQGYGNGVVDPYRAVTERLTDQPARAQQALPPLPDDPARAARADRWETIGLVAMWVALGLAAAVALIAAIALLTPYGRKRRWRPTRAAAQQSPKPDAETEEPEDVFFRVPTAPTS